MSKSDIIRKLASRKFWICIIGFVTSILVAFNVGENQIAQVTAVITAFGTLVAYILAEGSADVASIKSTSTTTTTTITESKNVNMESKLSAKQTDNVAKTLTSANSGPSVEVSEEVKSDSSVVSASYDEE